MKRFLFLQLILCSCLNNNSYNDGWIQLFNGNDLSGWEIRNGTAEISVLNNEIVGKTVKTLLILSYVQRKIIEISS